MRVLLRGSYDSFNLGDDLALIALVRILRQEVGGTREGLEVYVSRRLGSLEKLGGLDALQLQDSPEIDDLLRIRPGNARSPWPRALLRFRLLLTLTAFFSSICVFRISQRCISFGRLIRFLAGLDVIHYKGGGFIAGRWRNRLLGEILLLRAARLINPRVKVVGTGLGLGPFADRWSSLLARAFLRRFDALFVRDHRSREIAEALNPELKVRCRGDDVLLLAPMIERLSHSQNDRTVAAINLKDFPDHRYGIIGGKIDELLAVLREKGLRVEFFSFGDNPGPCDRQVLESLLLQHRDLIQTVHNPYEEGLAAFLEHLSRARLGFGFAYHFPVVLALMDTCPIVAYAGDYYEQKIQGAAQLLHLPFVFDMNALLGLDMRSMVEQALQSDVPPRTPIESLQLEMSREYAALYRELLRSAVGAGAASHPLTSRNVPQQNQSS